MIYIFCNSVTARGQEPGQDERYERIENALKEDNFEELKKLIVPGERLTKFPRYYWNTALYHMAETGDEEGFELVYKLAEPDRDRVILAAVRGGNLGILSSCIARWGVPGKGGNSDHWGPLALAASMDRMDLVRRLLGSDFRVDESDEMEMNALMYAAGNGNLEMMQLLLDRGARINPTNYFTDDPFWKYPPIYFAAKNGHTGAVRMLLDLGADPASPHIYYSLETAIEAAASNGHTEIVEMLMPLMPEGRSRYLINNALLNAIRNGHPGTVKMMLDKGVRMDFNNHPFPLSLAAENGDVGMLEIVLAYITDIREKDYRLHSAIGAGSAAGQVDAVKFLLEIYGPVEDPNEFLTWHTKKESVGIAGFWLDHGADIDRYDRYDGSTLLLEAARWGDLEMVKFLVERGADIYATDSDGCTALMLAAAGNDPPKVNYLLSLLRWKDQVDYKGDNALMYACYDQGSTEIIELLLSNGFLVNHRDRWGRTALMKTVMYELNEMDGPYGLEEMNRWGRDKAELLISRGADIHAKDYEGMTALMFAIMEGKYEVAKLLLEKGARLDDMNIYGEPATVFYNYWIDYEGNMARVLGLKYDESSVGRTRRENQYTRDSRLFEAVRKCDVDSVRYALDRGADINSGYDHEGSRPMVYALVNGCSVEMLKLMVENGAWAGSASWSGTTALMRAVMAGDHETAAYFLSKDVDVNSRNDYGNSALIFAAKNGDDRMIDLLVEAGADLAADGENAVRTARRYGHYDVVDQLVRFGVEDHGKIDE